MRCRGRSRRRGRCAGVSAAGVHDDAGAFPGFNESFAGVRAVELLHEIIHVGHLLQQVGGVGVHFFQERAAVHNLAARHIHHAGKGIDGVRQGGDAGGGHAASGCAGFGQRGRAEVADGGGFVEQVLLAELHNLAFAQIHLAEFVEVAGLLEMIGKCARQNKCGIFQGRFGLRLGIARAAGGGIGKRGLGGDGGIISLERGNVGGEIQRGVAIPDGLVFGGVGGGDTRANHVYLVCESDVHIGSVVCCVVTVEKIVLPGVFVKPFGEKLRICRVF